MVIKNDQVKLCRDFEFQRIKKTTIQRPSSTKIQIKDITCSSANRLEEPTARVLETDGEKTGR